MSKAKRETRVFELKPAVVAVALVCAAPAHAQPVFQVPLNADADMSRYSENNIEFGGGYVSNDSFKFGEFTGLKDEGAFGTLNINWLQRDAGQDSKYWSVFGSNLGLPSRVFKFGFGDQGKYSLSAGFDQLTRYQFDSTSFIFDGLGGTNLTLPAGFAKLAGQPPAAAATIAAAERPFDIKQERSGFNLGGTKLFDNWSFEAKYRHEERDGTKLIGAVIGNSGGNPRSVIVPRPTEDTTQQFEAILRYADLKTQFQAGYYFSLYDPDNNSLTWQNPYTNAAWAAAANTAGAQGRISLDPKNQFHQVNLTGAHNYSSITRITGTLSYGVMTQDEGFLPYTVNPGLAAPLGLPRSSLDGKIENTLLDLGLNMRPLPKLYLKASYRYDDRDNRTPQAQYSYIGGDSQNQGAATDKVRTNLPVSSTQHTFKLDGDYAIAPGTKLRGQYEYDNIDRTFQAVSKVEQHAFSAELRRIMSELFTGGLRYTYSTRDGSGYDCSVPVLASYATVPTIVFPALGQTVNCDNHPLQRKYHLADRDQNRIKAFGSMTPSETTSLHLAVDYYKDKYDDSPLGLTDMTGWSATADGSWMIRENVSSFAFYTYERLSQDQKGQSFTGTAGTAFDPLRAWAAGLDEGTDTFGLGVNFTPIEKRLDVGAQYIYSRSKGATTVTSANQALVPVGPVPDVKSTLNSLQLYARYALNKTTTLRLNYWYEKYKSDNWSYDNATFSSSNNVILTGQTSPDYDAHVVGVSLAIKNW